VRSDIVRATSESPLSPAALARPRLWCVVLCVQPLRRWSTLAAPHGSSGDSSGPSPIVIVSEPKRQTHSPDAPALQRQRHCRPRVTDQGSQSIIMPAIIRLSEPPRCCVRGCQRRWIGPFSPLGPRRRRREDEAACQKFQNLRFPMTGKASAENAAGYAIAGFLTGTDSSPATVVNSQAVEACEPADETRTFGSGCERKVLLSNRPKQASPSRRVPANQRRLASRSEIAMLRVSRCEFT
jgi:hypothetical protein